MTAFVIAIVITIIAAWLIIKNFQPQTVLLLAGLSLLTITAVFYPDNSILYGKAKSTGSTWLDIFTFAKNSLSTQIAGIGLIIIRGRLCQLYGSYQSLQCNGERLHSSPANHQGALRDPGCGVYLRTVAARRDFQRRRAGDDVISDVLPGVGTTGCQ